MRTAIAVFLELVLTASMLGQNEWSVPEQIAAGANNDMHPAVANAPGWLYGREEYMAFSRSGKDICILSTEQSGTRWGQSPFSLTHDSSDNDFPSLVWAPMESYNDWRLMLVWQSRREGNLEILYSQLVNEQWSTPMAVTSDPRDDRLPHIAQRDSGYGLVWEREGEIMFAEYLNQSWSTPERVTPDGDSLNSHPQVQYVSDYPTWKPMVIWQRRKVDSSFAVMYSIRGAQAWTTPDTMVSQGDSQFPRFFKVSYFPPQFQIGWTLQTSGQSMICSRNGTYYSNNIAWENIELFPIYSGQNVNQSVNGLMFITEGPTPPSYLWFAVAAWEIHAILGGDSIALLSGPYNGMPTILGVPFSSGNRNPDVSTGVGVANGVRFWTVWESNTSGTWKIWGSSILIILGDVAGGGEGVTGFNLLQNYPNPFNPTTTIQFSLPLGPLVATRHAVSLRVYDLLGCEVASLVNETLSPGTYEKTFDATGLAGGVYLCRLQVGGYAQSRKLILLK